MRVKSCSFQVKGACDTGAVDCSVAVVGTYLVVVMVIVIVMISCMRMSSLLHLNLWLVTN